MAHNEKRPVRVMVVDDSMVVRKLVIDLLGREPGVQVVASAVNGREALEKLADKALAVDLLTLDVEMPEMDGLTALPQILRLRPEVNVIMVSTLTHKATGAAIRAISLGAAGCVGKPSNSGMGGDVLESFRQTLGAEIRKVMGMAAATPPAAPAVAGKSGETLSAPQEAIRLSAKPLPLSFQAVAIGSSTGGPKALTDTFAAMKPFRPLAPVFITQHMPPSFTTLLAKQLHDVSGWNVFEAQDGMRVEPGSVYLAPGGFHMLAAKAPDGQVRIALNTKEPENFCRPSVEPMLRSLMELYGNRILMVMLTGMGADGLAACRKLHELGGAIMAQDKESSVVWGMPGAVAQAGICHKVLPLRDIPAAIQNIAKGCFV